MEGEGVWIYSIPLNESDKPDAPVETRAKLTISVLSVHFQPMTAWLLWHITEINKNLCIKKQPTTFIVETVGILTFVLQNISDSQNSHKNIDWICRREFKDTFQQEQNITEQEAAKICSSDSISFIHNGMKHFRLLLSQIDAQGKPDVSWAAISWCIGKARLLNPLFPPEHSTGTCPGSKNCIKGNTEVSESRASRSPESMEVKCPSGEFQCWSSRAKPLTYRCQSICWEMAGC